jgi:hypothetical protein
MPKFVHTLHAAVGALSLAALAACSNPTGGDRVPVAFTPIALHLAGTPPFAAGSSAAGTVTIYGTYGRGGCDIENATARLDGNLLVFRLALQHNTQTGCPDILQLSSYRADVTTLAPGTYHVRVEHAGTADVADPGQNAAPLGNGVRLETDVVVQ